MLLNHLPLHTWHLVVICPRCHTRQSIGRDWTHGRFIVPQTYGHTCEVCHVFNLYDSRDVQLYLHGGEESNAHG
jgi:hypothetical protein